MSHIFKLLDTLPVCQDFNRSLCSRLNCRFVHLTEDDKVEVCDQRVAVCRDHANGQCRRKLCKYYHIPVALPPANIMATIFNHQPAQQPLHHQNQLGAASTKSPNEHKQQEQLQKQQLTITKNANRATSATFTSISNYNNNNNLMNSFSNNILNTNITEKNKNILAPYQHNTMSPTPLSRQISSSSIKSFTAAQNFASPKSKSESPSIFALTTSTSTIPTPVMAAKTSNISATATANVYTPTFQHYLNTQQLITPTLGYYDIIDPSLSNINTNCFSVLPSNPTYAAAPMLYRSASATQHKNEDSCEASNLKRIQINSNILHQYPSNTSNLPETITTSTK